MLLKFRLAIVLVLCGCLYSFSVHAQQSNNGAPVRVAVLAPLYLDSAFNNYTYKLNSKSIPKFILPGLDFYNGIMLAVDSLQKENRNLDVWVYDTKKAGTNISKILGDLSYMNFSLILASITSADEQKAISDFGFNNNIPIVSSTYPNDAALTSNPFFILINPTLKTHIEGIHNYLYEKYSSTQILYITKKGSIEDNIYNYFSAMDSKQPLKYRKVVLSNNFTANDIANLLDKNNLNTVVCGTMDETFCISLLKILNTPIPLNNPATVFGMPSWTSTKSLSSNLYPNIQMVSSTPFNYSKTDRFGATLTQRYKELYFTSPSDMVFRGYECMYHFSKLLLKHKINFINNLSDTDYKITNDFVIEPVTITSNTFVPDYLENKKLYFIKKQGSTIKSIE